MLSVVQRVSEAEIKIDGEITARGGSGLLLLVGVERGDCECDAELLAEKILKTRIFEDGEGKMNLSVVDIGGSIVAVPNFTLTASYRKGNRPDFMNSEAPVRAKALFEYFCTYLSEKIHTECGVFGADMKVSLCNDGPVTLVMDSRVLSRERMSMEDSNLK